MLKTRRTASFWLALIGAAFIPVIFFLVYVLKADKMVKQLQMMPWESHLFMNWQVFNAFLFPMFIIMMAALVPQIEYRNNTWKQVFASPQSNAEIFFSKFLAVQGMVLLCVVSFNVFVILAAVVANVIHPQYSFFKASFDWEALVRLNLRTYASVLGISALQFLLGMRFKSFIAPVGIGLALLIGGQVASGFHWEHADLIPYSHPTLTLQSIAQKKGGWFVQHEYLSIAYAAGFLLLGYLDLRFRKEKG
ncbi:hypothetical protein GCM10023184_44770 [Flaviaesturariibacter amylovorans]|uniref:ABC transporter permease n=2 Tax=Flaviaesturariibacter amylovorans TaxID=1084520 RepID=A0ABP8HT34_9BACT